MLLASVNPELEPLIKWTFALIAGGGTAGIFSTAAAVTRVKSTAVSGGATNFVVATVENIGSVFLTAISLFVPVLAGIIIVVFLYFCVQLIVRAKRTVAGLKKRGA